MTYIIFSPGKFDFFFHFIYFYFYFFILKLWRAEILRNSNYNRFNLENQNTVFCEI